MKKFTEEKHRILESTTGAYCNYPSVRLFIHPFSIRIVYISAKLSLHPNLLSTVNIFISLSCLLFFLFHMYALSLLFFWARLVIDYSDGALARYTYKTSKFGDQLDKVTDYVCYLGLWILISLQLNSSFEKIFFLISCTAYLLCVHYYIIPRLVKLKRRAKVKQFFLDRGIVMGMGVFFELEFWSLVLFAIGVAPGYLFVLVILNNLDLLYRIYEILKYYDPLSSPLKIN